MANVLLKSLKFTKVLSGRLSFSRLKPYINEQLIVPSYKKSTERKAYTTAAYKFATKEEDSGNYHAATSNTKISVQSIDKDLSDVDHKIRRTGRIQLENVEKIFSSISDKEMTSSTHGLYLIRCCKYCQDEPPSKRIELVNQIWNRYQELGIQFDVAHYNALLDVHICNGLSFDPAEILASMEDVNIAPNRGTYMLIMKKYCQDGNISGASEILEFMKEKGMSADEKVFNYLIEGHVKNNDFVGAKDMIELMRASNLQPTTDTHIILACGYASQGEKDKMISSLKECGQECDTQNYLKVIEVLATSGNHELIDEVLSLIQDVNSYEPYFVNLSIDLIHKNQLQVAYKLISLVCNPSFFEPAGIFMKQLIKCDKPLSDVMNFCERILNDSLHKNIYITASNYAARIGKKDYAVPLFEKMSQNGYYLRPSHFWPLLVALNDKKSPEDAWFVLKKMGEIGIPADFTTYYDALYPSLKTLNSEYILQNVKKSGQAVETATDALFVYYCNVGKLDSALDLTALHDVKIGFKFDAADFLERFSSLRGESKRSYLKLLKFIFMGAEHTAELTEVQGELLAVLIMRKTKILEQLLNTHEDLQFSPQALRVCENIILQENPGRQAYVRKLKDMNLQRKKIFKDENMSIEEENNYINYLQAQNIPNASFLNKRLQYHIRTKNITRVSELLTLFEEQKWDLSPLLLTNLMSMYCMAADYENATKIINKLATDFPSFKLDISRSLDYVTLLLRYGKFEESAEALAKFIKEAHTNINSEQLTKSVKKLNTILCDIGDVEFVRKMQNLLLPLSKDSVSKKVFLENVIHHHLQRNDIPSAFEEFKNTILTHRVPVYLNTLLKKCLALEETGYLQKVIDLTTNFTNKSFALLELAVALIETSNSQKAVKIIENLGRELDPKALDDICLRLSYQNKLVELEQLIYITRSLDHVDREILYNHAFRTCANRKDFEKAKELFTALKEEVVEPKSQTVQYVQDLFLKNNQPFSLDFVLKNSPDLGPLAAEATKTFVEQLETGNVEAALKELTALKKGYIRTLSIKNLTNLVDLCIQNNSVTDLSLNVQAMSYIIDNVRDVLKPLMEKYSEAGDIAKFAALSSFIPDFSLMKIGFNSYYSQAFISSGKYEDLLSMMEQHADKKNKLFCPLAYEELMKFPELEERVFSLSEKYLEAKYTLPMSVLWSIYYYKENFEKADEIYKKYSPIQVDRVDNLILKKIKENEDVAFAQKFVNFITPLSVRPRVKDRAYGLALDLYVLKGMYDEAVALAVEAEKQNLQLHKYYTSTLVTLKNVLEKENRPVPFTVSLDESSGPSLDSDKQ